MAHTATADGKFDVVIPPHQSASTVVTKAGAIEYYCRFHPNMRGRLQVAD
jgi:plastocyanin